MSKAPEKIVASVDWENINGHRVRLGCVTVGTDGVPSPFYPAHYIRKDVSDALVAAAREEAPRVKPLVWEYHPAGTIAAPPTGHAYIIDTRTKGRVYSIKGFSPQREFASLDEAKAAAQADYEARILAALE